MKNKFVIILIAIFYIPLALLYSLIWGVICGILGNILGTFQDWKKLTISDYKIWKFFPKTSAYNWWYTNNRICTERSAAERKMIIDEVLAGKRQAPHPITTALCWAFWYFLVYLPVRLIWGIFVGPIYAGIDAYDFFQEKILKKEVKIAFVTDENDQEISGVSFERV